MPSAPVRSPVRRHYVVAGLLAAVILVAIAVAAVVGQLRDGEESNDQASAEAAGPLDRPRTPSPSPTRDDSSLDMLPAPPPEGACRRLTPADLTRAVDDSARTTCRDPHTARTISVGALDARVLAGSGVDARVVGKQAGAECDRAFTRYVGGEAEDRRLSRLQPVWFTADDQAIAAGALWVRCDVVAYETDERLAALPRDLAGALDDNSAPQLGLCSTRAPQAEGARNVACSQPHTWRAFAVIPLDEGRWPGAAAVRDQGVDRCSAQARTVQGDPDEWRYGWQWPTKQQWQAGRTYGYCWVPDD
jgi:hypothetical protein